ncbi:hypothetical protein ACHAWF_017912 [Thalassiosira exigua]
MLALALVLHPMAVSISRMRPVILLSMLLLASAQSVAASARFGIGKKIARPPPPTAATFDIEPVPRGGGRTSASAAQAKASTEPPSQSTAAIEGLKNTLASGLAAACSKTILAPFDTLKTVQQHVEGGKSLGLLEAGRSVVARPGGVLNLYAGLAVSALGSMPSVGLYFGVYSYCKRTLGPRLKQRLGSGREAHDGRGAMCSDGALQTLSIACSAAIGNTVASFSRVPYEVVKQSLQTGQYSSTRQAMSQMWKEGGMRSFFPLGGVSIQMVRDIPYAVFTLLSYEFIKERWVLTRSADDPANRWLRDMIAGATAGGIGSYLTNPFDVVKTRLQTTGGTSYGGSIAACAAAVLDEGGPGAFLRGSVPRLMHKIPANGFFFVFYEFFRRVLRVE